MPPIKEEILKSDLPSKEIWFYIDEEKKINQKSREVFKKVDKIIHYPRGFDVEKKFKTIERFTFLGFKGNLPVGIIKSVNYGWGFTKTLNPFRYYIDEEFELTEVVIEKNGKVVIDLENQILYLNEKSLELLHKSFSTVYNKNRLEVDFVLKLRLSELFPSVIEKPQKRYVANSLATSLDSWGNSIEEFSEPDKKAISDLFDKLAISTDFLSNESLAKTKVLIDVKYIQKILEKFKKLMEIITDSDRLEDQWQEFLRENNWIFSSIFAQPVILFKREGYVGGKTINNENGKFSDFLIQNSLSDNISFLEIKTHKTSLISKYSYRGEDVFSASKNLSGGIVQVLNQRDNFQKEFYAFKVKDMKRKREKMRNYETINSKCVLLIGSTKDLDEGQLYSFEMFRSNSRDVEIITFNELEQKIESLQQLMKK